MNSSGQPGMMYIKEIINLKNKFSRGIDQGLIKNKDDIYQICRGIRLNVGYLIKEYEELVKKPNPSDDDLINLSILFDHIFEGNKLVRKCSIVSSRVESFLEDGSHPIDAQLTSSEAPSDAQYSSTSDEPLRAHPSALSSLHQTKVGESSFHIKPNDIISGLSQNTDSIKSNLGSLKNKLSVLNAETMQLTSPVSEDRLQESKQILANALSKKNQESQSNALQNISHTFNSNQTETSISESDENPLMNTATIDEQASEIFRTPSVSESDDLSSISLHNIEERTLPTLVVYYRTTCPPSREFIKNIWNKLCTIPGIQDKINLIPLLTEQFDAVTPDLIEKKIISSVPTLHLFKRMGEKYVEIKDRSTLEQLLNSLRSHGVSV
jgi:hypothetical protein